MKSSCPGSARCQPGIWPVIIRRRWPTLDTETRYAASWSRLLWSICPPSTVHLPQSSTAEGEYHVPQALF